MGSILSTVRDSLRERNAVNRWTVEDVTVGARAVLVELADDGDGEARTAGLAHRPPGDPNRLPSDPSDPEELLGPLQDAGTGEASWLPRAVAIATLNALSAPFIDWQSGDPMARLDPGVETITTVGLFRPAFRKFADVTVRVIEREQVVADSVTAPDGVVVESYRPEQTAVAMQGTEVVFVTGSTLVYGGIERSLEAVPAEATAVVIGATASMLPEQLFAAGADVVAGVAVDDTGRAREAVAAGACGTDLHDHGVRKGFVAETQPAGLGHQEHE